MMRKVFITVILISTLMVALEAGATPSFSGSPGYISVPVVTVNGDPSTWISGILGADGDDNGTVYLFAEDRYILRKEEGATLTVLHDYGYSVFGSFIKLWGETLYCGESLTGTVTSIPVGGGSPIELFTLSNNYDCDFNSQSVMFLSANPSWAGNLIYAWWEGMTEPELLANVGGNSGPIAVDSSDNLYYGRATAYPPGPEDIVYYTAAQIEDALTTGIPLTPAVWTVYAPGAEAPVAIAFDRATPVQNLISASTAFGTLRRISPADTGLLGAGTFPGSPRFTGRGALRAFLPDGGSLIVNCTDFLDSFDSTVYRLQPCPQNFILGSGNYGSAGRSEIAVFRPATGLWAVRGGERAYFGREGDLPVPGDYTGTGSAHPAVFRPSTGLWAVNEGDRLYFGRDGDIPVPRDFDGDGMIDHAVFRPSSGLWAVCDLSRVYFGREGDFPVPADYGSGGPEVGIFRPQTGLWVIRDMSRFYFGLPGDLPVPGDYNGNGTSEPGIYRPAVGLWAIRDLTRIYFGSMKDGDIPLPADGDGDGTTDPGIFRPAGGLWAIRGVTRVYFGAAGDFPATK
ncbi:MAG: hypothetical protein V1789_03800 [PVC group bacterium]